VLLLVFLISQRFNFIVLDWLLKKLFGISVIALLIIFHPEIRQGSPNLGKRNIFKKMLKYEDPNAFVKQIVEGAEKLAEDKHGGLIAIEKSDSLAAYIQSGEIIDSRVSADLIRAIFTPNNPLHDGALVNPKRKNICGRMHLPARHKPGIEPCLRHPPSGRIKFKRRDRRYSNSSLRRTKGYIGHLPEEILPGFG